MNSNAQEKDAPEVQNSQKQKKNDIKFAYVIFFVYLCSSKG
jgi:hypothetical protein